ncbi:hypothetical protein QWY90_04605 [Flavobacterium paronense]|uniref:Uncharacterized protein n=1 Tax=Flavobacterium paronense TaxID=1392775 RepID=A0ABV5GFP3_9FLAO|nr:hypothetical protein [Flavobacterium paronense]MDN3676587.1 hypothetical protein [Flavobacterium paronense]
MIKYIMSQKLYTRVLIGIGFCFLIFILGYFVLNHISTMEDPPLGNTVYILIGSALVFSSGLGVVLILKYLYDYKKKKERRERRRKKHKIFYLKDIDKEKKLD